MPESLCGLPGGNRLLLAFNDAHVLFNVVGSKGEVVGSLRAVSASGLASNLDLLLEVIVERRDYSCLSRTN